MPKKNDPVTTLGREIRAARLRLRYSQDGLGAQVGVSGTIISRWETGRYKPPIESLARLVDIVGGSEDERDDLYARWVRLAGYREPKGRSAPQEGDKAPAATHGGPGSAGAETVEGAMGRAIIDQVSDPGARLDLVLRLRQWARTSPEDGGENDAAPDPAPSPLEGQGPPGDVPPSETPS